MLELILPNTSRWLYRTLWALWNTRNNTKKRSRLLFPWLTALLVLQFLRFPWENYSKECSLQPLCRGSCGQKRGIWGFREKFDLEWMTNTWGRALSGHCFPPAVPPSTHWAGPKWTLNVDWITSPRLLAFNPDPKHFPFSIRGWSCHTHRSMGQLRTYSIVSFLINCTHQHFFCN